MGKIFLNRAYKIKMNEIFYQICSTLTFITYIPLKSTILL